MPSPCSTASTISWCTARSCPGPPAGGSECSCAGSEGMAVGAAGADPKVRPHRCRGFGPWSEIGSAPFSRRSKQRSHPAICRILRGVKRLTPLDGSFLRVETSNAHMHVAWCGLFALQGDRPAAHARAGCRRHRRAARVRAAIPAAARLPAARTRGAVLGRRPALPRARARDAHGAGEPGRLARALHDDGRRRAVRAAAARPAAVAPLLPPAARGRQARHRLQDAPRARGREVGRRAGPAAVRRRPRRAADDPGGVEACRPARRTRPDARLAARRCGGNACPPRRG